MISRMRPRLRTSLSLLIGAWLVAGCAGVPTPGSEPSYGWLTLREPLTLPAGTASVRLQYGQSVASNAVQEHDPFCVFEIDTVSDTPQRVAPGRFRIVSVHRSEETFAGMPALRPWRVAFDSDGGPSHLYFKTHFRLSHETQPVRMLTCMSNQMMPGIGVFMRHLTLDEIRRALGERFLLEIAPVHAPR